MRNIRWAKKKVKLCACTCGKIRICIFLDERRVGWILVSKERFGNDSKLAQVKGNDYNDAYLEEADAFSQIVSYYLRTKRLSQMVSRRNEATKCSRKTITFYSKKAFYKITKGITKCNRSKVKRRPASFNNGGTDATLKASYKGVT